mgnify:CR=1 FL=1|tara:strand:+ start:22 stop:249 length:228 start_codon:yes stop_codon:yes gene_type:complete
MAQRNYKKEYTNYHSRPKQVRNRTMRNAANRLIGQKGMDVHHIDGNPKNNSKRNLALKPKSQNRSFRRNRNAGKL